MAFVPPQVWDVSFLFRDNNGNTAGTGIYLPFTVAYADAQAYATSVANGLAAVSDARVTSFHVSAVYTNDVTTEPPATSEVERKLALSFDAGVYKNAYRMEVPSPIFGLEQPRTDVADPANAGLVALLDLLLNGPLGPGNGPRTYFGTDITALARAVITHRSRKPRA